MSIAMTDKQVEDYESWAEACRLRQEHEQDELDRAGTACVATLGEIEDRAREDADHE